MSKHLTEHERYQIESWLKEGVNVKKISSNLGKSFTSIYYEIRKGMVELQHSDLTTYRVYLADVAQMKYDLNKKNCGRVSKASRELLDYISDMILNQKLSPYAVSEALKDTEFEFKPCEKTIYNYIAAGLVPNVTQHDMPYKKKAETEKGQDCSP